MSAATFLRLSYLEYTLEIGIDLMVAIQPGRGQHMLDIFDSCKPSGHLTVLLDFVFRKTRVFRIYDGPTEVHNWSLAKKIKRKALGK